MRLNLNIPTTESNISGSARSPIVGIDANGVPNTGATAGHVLPAVQQPLIPLEPNAPKASSSAETKPGAANGAAAPAAPAAASVPAPKGAPAKDTKGRAAK